MPFPSSFFHMRQGVIYVLYEIRIPFTVSETYFSNFSWRVKISLKKQKDQINWKVELSKRPWLWQGQFQYASHLFKN